MIVSTSARLGQIGVAVGLAWTSVGGEVMVVEATKMIGDGNLVLTGQLGDVMKESATLALSWIRSNSKRVTHISFIIHQKRHSSKCVKLSNLGFLFSSLLLMLGLFQLGIDRDTSSLMNNMDVHIHFPEGAISKDGPSAGVTITTALVSLFTEKPAIQGININ